MVFQLPEKYRHTRAKMLQKNQKTRCLELKTPSINIKGRLLAAKVWWKRSAHALMKGLWKRDLWRCKWAHRAELSWTPVCHMGRLFLTQGINENELLQKKLLSGCPPHFVNQNAEFRPKNLSLQTADSDWMTMQDLVSVSLCTKKMVPFHRQFFCLRPKRVALGQANFDFDFHSREVCDTDVYWVRGCFRVF